MSKDKRINEEIRASLVKVINEAWEQLWVMPLEKALETAEQAELDLVEIGEHEWVVLTKLMDYGKFLFKQHKNISKSKSNSKKTELKTLKITYKIWDHDLEIRRTQAAKFAKDWHPLKVALQLRWRENQYAAQASEKIESFVASIEEFYKLDWKIAKTWNTFSAMLHPKK